MRPTFQVLEARLGLDGALALEDKEEDVTGSVSLIVSHYNVHSFCGVIDGLLAIDRQPIMGNVVVENVFPERRCRTFSKFWIACSEDAPCSLGDAIRPYG